ncbi:sigma-54-dependent transcriptional regulator [Zavarzinia compransoris]|uniref:Fis family transcriptional regulator n=1 Tax=Zavarzinia compransoris TaxID=1264899 RepID=A0A317E7A7_9PROT|nr:sigma-54 dependent transcriptional regulator [Zavarzinia compransoris]PWR22164.1 Fis family transcriptional regulator [Zavarzinia compransoris]TDP47085.1 two-component system C4-dicarboxylate transport response regulator DctD [Zavarzinia compransoris]
MSIEVAFVDDDPDLRAANAQSLGLAGFAVREFDGAAAALAALDAGFAGVVVTDVRMPGIDGIELFRRLRALDPELPVILITGHGDIDMAVSALHEGAYDFIAKPFAAARLVESVRRAGDKRRLVLENRALRAALDAAAGDAPLMGATPAMERLRARIRSLADLDVDVLVHGETGSGKEMVAQALHQWGRRRARRLVALNCGALPETVIDSELFGHEAGAFTGAQKKRIGQIELADGGTLFLDEIESMPLNLQAKLLRVLEDRQVTPLGGNQQRRIDMRVIAATKVDLAQAAKAGGFRPDLAFRLDVVTLRIPPLRERRDDIPLLFEHFAARAAERFGRGRPAVSPHLRRRFAEHDWPGNVRELAHCAERAVLGLLDEAGPEPAPAAPESLADQVAAFEAGVLRAALERHKGHIPAVLDDLGLPRKTLYDKLARHGLVPGDFRG